MVESKKLNEYFEGNRECSPDKLNSLKKLWLDPLFEEQCVAMFEEINFSINELTKDSGLKNLLLAENTKIQLQGEKQKLNTIAKTELNSAANDEDYNSTRQYKKIA